MMYEWCLGKTDFNNYSHNGHCLNQCWHIVNCTLKNKHQWNLDRHTKFFIQEKLIKNVVGKSVVFLHRPKVVLLFKNVDVVTPGTRLVVCKNKSAKALVSEALLSARAYAQVVR